MKIGVFDSGLGGLWLLRHIREVMPEYDYVFIGDQKNVPYGNKTVPELLKITTQALEFLYEKQNCKVVLLACNTVSSNIYKELKEWVNSKYPNRLIFGLVEPTVQALKEAGDIAIFATKRTIASEVYQTKLAGNNRQAYGIAMPELATLIESGQPTIDYIDSFKDSVPTNAKCGTLLCTHYGIALEDFKKAFPNINTWYLQEKIIPKFMNEYFQNNKERLFDLSLGGSIKFFVTEKSSVFDSFLGKWFRGSASETV